MLGGKVSQNMVQVTCTWHAGGHGLVHCAGCVCKLWLICHTHLLTNCPSLKEWSQRERKTRHTDVKPIKEGDFINFRLLALL